MRFVLQIVAISFAGAMMGFGLNAASGRPITLSKPVHPASSSGVGYCGVGEEGAHAEHGHSTMKRAEAVEACGSCSAAFVDARGAAAFAEGHIPGAVHLKPAGDPSEGEVLKRLRSFRTIVVYDAGAGCGLAERVADRLIALGFADVRLLEDDWNTWQEAGGPAQSGACGTCDLQEAHDGLKGHEGHGHGEAAGEVLR